MKKRMKPTRKPEVQSIRQAASAAGLSPSAVFRKMKETTLPPAKAAEILKRDRRSLHEAREALADVKAKLGELDLAEREGRLINKDTVERHQREFVQVVTNGLLTAPQPLSLLLGNKPPAECAKIIGDYNRRLLETWKKMGEREQGN